MCRSAEEARAVANELGYPVVLKRAQSLAASGVRLVEDEAALIEEIGAMDGEELLVQRYVRGRVGGTTILMDHGVPVRYFSFYKLFNWPHAFGPSGGGELTDHPEIGDMIRRIGAMLNFRGLCSIDWLEEAETGLIYLVEFNPRPTPTTYYSSHAGSDFVTALRGIHLRDTAAEPLPPQTPAGQVFCMFPEAAFRAVEDRNIGLLLRSLRVAEWTNPRLLVAQFRRLAGHFAVRFANNCQSVVTRCWQNTEWERLVHATDLIWWPVDKDRLAIDRGAVNQTPHATVA